ncbi:2-isopropylmalate synthase [Sulfobacillus harzensis]|uniref:2-isopropylmalate synthase n=1 Tax=Sulfobacillus harzensis TaxID=2729629 RepID=A0A7Y0L1S3_9FIRM|nr:2-isopropylmalate synthase [Sulfobacillus harzensis]NMP21702.1 2-isopropylmalate synthase [Sulfobacillus harzensis]
MNERVRIFDTTLRDGEQSPGVALTIQEKVAIAHQLERLQVDVIEAGFPVSSAGDFEAVRQVASEIETCQVAALARCEEHDIETAARALEPAHNARIHVFIATSEVHMRAKLKLSPEAVLQRIADAVRQARSYREDVEFSAEDATRSDPQFLLDAAMAAYEAGARTLNFPDTVGYAMSDEYARLIGFLRESIPADAILSVHCHDDLGLAVANSLAGVKAGARQVEVAVNGIGERAGNAALEEVAVSLSARADHWKLTHGLNLGEIYRTSRLVSQCTGMIVQANKAIVGDNAFRHESGIHQDGMLKDPTTYEFLDAVSLGQGSRLVLGKHSGRHALRERLEHLGLSYTADDLRHMQRRIKSAAEGKRGIDDGELMSIWQEMKMTAGESRGV